MKESPGTWGCKLLGPVSTALWPLRCLPSGCLGTSMLTARCSAALPWVPSRSEENCQHRTQTCAVRPAWRRRVTARSTDIQTPAGKHILFQLSLSPWNRCLGGMHTDALGSLVQAQVGPYNTWVHCQQRSPLLVKWKPLCFVSLGLHNKCPQIQWLNTTTLDNLIACDSEGWLGLGSMIFLLFLLWFSHTAGVR